MSNVYPPSTYRVWLCDPLGTRLAYVDGFNTLSYARAHGAIGRATLQVPLSYLPRQYLDRDYVWQIWRTPYGAQSRLVFAGMARRFRFHELNRRDVVDIEVHDGLGLLFSRDVQYAAGSSQADKSEMIDDIMKAIVRENLGGSATDSDRDLTGYNFEVESDVSLGPTTELSIANANVGETLTRLFWDSAAQGTPVFYDVEPFLTAGKLGWRFVTTTGQLGSDRTYNTGMPAVFSRNFGNLEAPDLTFDYTNEVTVARVGGQGEGSFREYVSSTSGGRRNASPWNRRELFYNGNTLKTTTALTKKAAQLKREGRPRKRFIAKLKDTPQTRYGVDWFYGDKVVVKAYGVSFDAWINAVSIGVDQDRRESLDSKVEVLL